MVLINNNYNNDNDTFQMLLLLSTLIVTAIDGDVYIST